MWNLFEEVASVKGPYLQTFKNLSDKLAQDSRVINGVEAAIRFWRFRYWTGSKFNDRFNDLRFRPNDRRDHVEAVLREQKADTASQLLATMIIVYRLRNNLFHGLKTVDMLNDQAANLDMASKALASILEVSGRYWVEKQNLPSRLEGANTFPH